ncbi:hypothetical protein II5_05755 [Bacillus cereus MSX-A1]|nr:hypothetical protein II5_05755 [Bacillus cereus MSX-A1]MDR4291048.1 hypothetical protein [Bacillus cereus]
MQLACFQVVSGQYFLVVEGIQISVPIRAFAADLRIGLGKIPLCSWFMEFRIFLSFNCLTPKFINTRGLIIKKTP